MGAELKKCLAGDTAAKEAPPPAAMDEWDEVIDDELDEVIDSLDGGDVPGDAPGRARNTDQGQSGTCVRHAIAGAVHTCAENAFRTPTGAPAVVNQSSIVTSLMQPSINPFRNARPLAQRIR